MCTFRCHCMRYTNHFVAFDRIVKIEKKCRNVRCRSYNLRIVVYYNHAYFTTSHSNYLQIQEVTAFNESKKSQEKKIKDYRKNEYHEGAVKQSPQ